jgi:hypothetical protein
MKAFKINSKAALAVITTTLSLTLSPSAKPKKRVKIIKQLQLLMFLNNKNIMYMFWNQIALCIEV